LTGSTNDCGETVEFLAFLIFMGFMYWRNYSYKPMALLVDDDGFINKEYKGAMFQLVGVKSDKEHYEIAFNLKVKSRFWYTRKYCFKREEFQDFLNCIDKGIEREFRPVNRGTIKVKTSHLKSDAVLSLTTNGSWQMYNLERSIVNELNADFNEGVI